MIEINRANSPYIYRQNPWNPRIIDKRENRHGARWQPFDKYPTEEEARAELLQLERTDSDEVQP